MRMSRFVAAMALAALVTPGTALAQAGDKQVAPAKPAAGSVNETLMHHEREMLDALTKKDFAAFQKLIVPGAWNIDENGYATVGDFMKQAKDPKGNLQFSYTASDMKVIDVDANARIVTYRLDDKGSLMGQPFPPTVYASTVWVNHAGVWHAVFHQESPAAPPARK